MARLFAISFKFKEQTYTAVISIMQSSGTSTVTIHIPNESLHPILGESTLTFDAQKGLPPDSLNSTTAKELLASILTAIEQYDQKWKSSLNENQPL